MPTKVSVVLRKISLEEHHLSAVLTSDNWQDHRQEECIKKIQGMDPNFVERRGIASDSCQDAAARGSA